MGFLDKLADLLAPSPRPVPGQPPSQKAPTSPPAEPALPPVSALLPKISARTAAEICQECKLDPDALILLSPQQTPAQFLTALQDKHLGSEMIKFLAQGLPDREGVAWAVRCVQKVRDKLPPAEVQAMQAAEAWVKRPTPETQRAAEAAAKRTEFQGPGAWAAQAAVWAGPACATAEATSDDEPKRLSAHAVSGAVQIAAAIAVRAKLGLPGLPSLQAPTSGAAGLPTIPQVNSPQLPGTIAQLHARIPNTSELARMAGQRLMGQAGVGTLPQVPAPGQASIPGMPTPPAIQAPAVQMSGFSRTAIPSVSVATPSTSGLLPMPNSPGIPIPPEVLVKVFQGQHEFIALGLEIASSAVALG